MICFNKQVDYGVQFLITLARLENNQQLSLRQFTTQHSMSFLFLQRIVASLKKKGLVKATKGAHGGYTLAKDPKDISFLNILEAIEGKYGITTCLRGRSCPREDVCDSIKFFRVLQKDLHIFMQGYTLASMMEYT